MPDSLVRHECGDRRGGNHHAHDKKRQPNHAHGAATYAHGQFPTLRPTVPPLTAGNSWARNST
jgi:hypothetical protein